MGRPLTEPFNCSTCYKPFDPGETVVFAHGGAKSYTFRTVSPMHLACAEADRYIHAKRESQKRDCAGCGRTIIVRGSSPRRVCSSACRQAMYRRRRKNTTA